MALGLMVGSLSSVALAQALPNGPLAEPTFESAPAAKPHKDTAHEAKATRHADAKATRHADAKAHTTPKMPRPLSDPTEPAVPTAETRPKETADPLSLGMKWNGTNDNSEKTRVQNYDGNAAGTGAAVGLNYHF